MFRVSHAPNVDLRARRKVREQALLNLKVASGTAWAGAVWAVMVFWFVAAESHEWTLFWRVVVGATVTAGLGWWMWSRQSRAAAWILGLLAAANLVVRVISTESYVVAVIGSLLCFVYYRAWRGTETLYELRQAEDADVAPVPIESGA